MRINFYEARLSEDDRPVLVKEKGVNYSLAKINSPDETADMIRKLVHIDELAEEYCYMIAMNIKNKVLGVFLISKGTATFSPVGTREIFMRALLIGAVQIIFCHNHPSGDATPSINDIHITKELQKAGKLMEIPLADHIIIGGNCYFSFYEAGMLAKEAEK